MKTLLVQPGPYGDILVCAPIAKWYTDRGYDVTWPIAERFYNLVSQLGYVVPFRIRSEGSLDSDWLKSDVMKLFPYFNSYQHIINLADRGPHPTAERIGQENFEQCKYRVAEVPFEEKYNLHWNRDIDKESSLVKILDLNLKEPYIFAHTGSSKGAKGIIPDKSGMRIIESSVIPGYTILDWYQVVLHSNVIYCTESSFQAFIDGFIKELSQPKYLISREAGGSCSTISEHWNKSYLK